jgi:hypothetical protein
MPTIGGSIIFRVRALPQLALHRLGTARGVHGIGFRRQFWTDFPEESLITRTAPIAPFDQMDTARVALGRFRAEEVELLVNGRAIIALARTPKPRRSERCP